MDERALGALRRALPDAALILDERRADYAADRSSAAPVAPAAVLRPRDTSEVQASLRWASAHGVPVTPRGAGTGKAGGCVPSPGGVVLSLEALDRVLAVRPEHGYAEVQAGVITGAFRQQMEAERGLFYPPDPNSLDECTLGGNAATNAGGPVAVKYGVTGDFVLGVDAVLADGSLLRVGRRQPKGVAGYDLRGLLVGSEGTLAVITGLRLALLPQPQAVAAALLSFGSVERAAEAVAWSRASGLRPRVLELVDGETLRRTRDATTFPIPAGTGALLLVEFDGSAQTCRRELAAFAERAPGVLQAQGADDEAQRASLWAMRRQMSTLLKRGFSGYVSEDVAVPVGAMPALVRALAPVAERRGVVIGTYGHAGDGNLHVNVLWERDEQRDAGHAAAGDVLRAALDLGGTITGEHGVGTLKLPYLPWEQGERALELQRAIKRQWDPAGILNPGKALPLRR